MASSGCQSGGRRLVLDEKRARRKAGGEGARQKGGLIAVTPEPQSRSQSAEDVLNIYSAPREHRHRFGYLLALAKREAAKDPLLVLGDFNAPHPAWGYHTNSATLVQWDHFRTLRENKESGPIIDIEQWTKQMVDDVQTTTEHLPEDIPAPCIDARLASLWRRYSRIENEWRKQKHNRELKLQLAALKTDIEEHALTLQRSQWDDICDRMQGSLGMRSTWQLLRHLLDPTTGRTEQRLRMTTLLHKYPGTDADLIQEAQKKYLPTSPPNP
ncbi:hypothetical protein HPB47_014434 [Ixodes persulcatus]|uniref:Uncharacterized protein n=1 Tax=Ixodes persulcatus TaxID=34615 RepID=A0AC60QW12_IXOPE|nr:hypothetical protein HPB47_014434 [Ixodes persulcatus]